MTSVISRMIEVCVFRTLREKTEYLLMKRADDEPVYPGIWQIVTGTMQEEESALKASLRELHEETGLVPVQYWVVPHTNAFYDYRRDAVHLVPFFAARVSQEAEVRLSHEHSAFTWTSYADARARLVWPGQRAGLDLVEAVIVGGEEASRWSEIPL
jgi:8-oxo-dGTP pyrophosphatase MutT (NUDIX family)